MERHIQDTRHHAERPREELTPELQRAGRLLVLMAIAASAAYAYFLLSPENRGDPWIWALVLFAEGLTIYQALGVWWTILAHDRHGEAPEVYAWRSRMLRGHDLPTIDVFITVAGEPIDLVQKTIVAARDMTLPHQTWVLDDGRSDELRELCLRMRVGYLRRPDSKGAKAGNVNAALSRTEGHFVAIFDADHVPEQDFLVEVLPHLVDERVAFAQSPQWYTNRNRLVPLGASEAQRIFYELICPGKNHFNAAFCVGTNVVFRRSALAEIGGLYARSLSEDIWTSLLLHRLGWRSVYVPKVLARGLAPDSLAAYFKQQFRWAHGGFELLLRGRLLRAPGLTLDQRLQYYFTSTNYLLGFATIAFQLVAPAFLLTGSAPVSAELTTWLAFYIPFLGLQLLVTYLQAGGFNIAAIVTSIGVAPVHVRAFLSVALRRGQRWNVTNASSPVQSIELVVPQMGLLILNILAIAVGVASMTADNRLGVLLAIGWATLHSLVLGRIVLEAFIDAARQRRLLHERAPARPALAPLPTSRGGLAP